MATTSLDAATAQALLDKFAPVIWLHSQEDYFPASVEWYFSHVQMIYQQVDNVRNVVVLAQVTDATNANQEYTDTSTGIEYSSSFVQTEGPRRRIREKGTL
jgi:hypothetical protein